MRMSLGRKVQVLLVLAAALVAVIGTVGLAVTASLTAVVSDFVDEGVPAFQALSQLATAVGRAAGASAGVEKGTLDSSEQEVTLKAIGDQMRLADSAAADLAKVNGRRGSGASSNNRVEEALKLWRQDFEKFSAAAKARQAAPGFAEAAAIQSTVSAHFEALRKDGQTLLETIDLDVAATRESARTLEARAERDAGLARWATIFAFLVAAGILAGAGALILRAVSRSMAGLQAQARALEAAVEAGTLDVRADMAALDAEFRPVVSGMNAIMDAYSRPIQTTTTYLARISNGDIPPPITDEYRGDFNEIKEALNRCIGTVNALVTDASALVTAAAEGRLGTRADVSKHQGEFRKIVEGVNGTLDAVIGPLGVAARCVDDISKGVIPARITSEFKGDFDLLKRNLNTCIDAVNVLVADAKALAAAAVAGQLGTRADASRHRGEFRAIVQGVNDTLEAIVTPFRVVADYCERLSHGDLPPRRTNPVHGDIVVMQASLNRCVDSIAALVADAERLAQAAVQGELAVRIDASKHEGAFRATLEGVNRTLDAVLAPVVETATALDRLSQRDLRARVRGDYRGDHAKIKESLNATAQALHDAIGQVASAVEQVSSAATQIAASSQAVAAGASEQASSLEETGASIESVSGMTKQSADNAQRANQLAQSARSAAGEGVASVDQMQAAMARIKASAEGTSQIIKDVSEIAFQTNLLALNAAVEAARAGEAGRGFAVVAEEVRSLALRAKEAATKTEGLIRQSMNEAAEGEATAKHVAGKLSEIVGGIGRVTEIVAEIAMASRAQSTGIDQINQAIAEMDKVTQQNASSAEESASAASELSGQSEELAAMVGAFRLEHDTAWSATALPGARARAAAPVEARRTNGKGHASIVPFPVSRSSRPDTAES